jgi:Domain of unknown function (DUF397)
MKGSPMALEFHKSTHSNPNGNCVEVAVDEDGHHVVRHSKFPKGSVLVFTSEEWEAFVAGTKDGEFD